jgi:hypothetical protein
MWGDVRLAGLKPQKTAYLSKTATFFLNHLADLQGELKSQIQVPEKAPLLLSAIVDPA